ncbi:MAG: hypothetical protein R3E66_07905 [bacterium]
MGVMIRMMALCIGAMVIGCGDDEASFAYNPNSVYPENWEQIYQLKKDCAQSPTHGSNYVKVWASPEASPAFDDRAMTMPVSAVLLKSQYKDSKCTELAGFTAARADAVATDGAVTWFWQRTEVDGTIGAEGQGNFCNTCHVDCANGICSEP